LKTTIFRSKYHKNQTYIKGGKMKPKYIKTTCRGCHGGCGVIVKVENNKKV